jgi:hypothetical protein
MVFHTLIPVGCNGSFATHQYGPASKDLQYLKPTASGAKSKLQFRIMDKTPVNCTSGGIEVGGSVLYGFDAELFLKVSWKR